MKCMNTEANEEKMKNLYHEIHGLKKLKSMIDKAIDNYSYNEYLKKVCEYNIRFIMKKYYNQEELTEEEMNAIQSYLFYSKNFYSSIANPEGPSFMDLRLQSAYGSGNFDYEELDLINKIESESRVNNKKR